MIPFPRSLRPLPGVPGGFALEVEAAHPAFLGHFPEHPVLPGVVQLDWALRMGAGAFGPLGPFQAIEHLKFQAIIAPEEPLELRLTWDPALHQLGFTYQGPQGPKSSGSARFGAP